MELKDKLDLLWKYLLLLVLVVGMCSHLCHHRSVDFHKCKYFLTTIFTQYINSRCIHVTFTF